MSEPEMSSPSIINESVKTWTILLITLVFVAVYVLAVVGAVKVTDAMGNLQSIVFVIIGYYFGRLPSDKVESSLKEQVNAHSNAAAAARQSEKVAAVERETLEEKIKNARIALEAGNPTEALGLTGVSKPVSAAIGILNS